MITRKIISILLLSLLFLSLFACNSKDSDEESDTKDVQPSIKLLSDIIINEDLGISYQVPLKWELMSAELSDRLVARLDSDNFDGNFIVYKPNAFYFNSDISSLLRVGSITKSEKSSDMKLTIDNYIELYQKFNANKNFSREKIHTNTLVITQLIIEKANLISFKNILMNKQNKIIQFDFSLKKEDYEKEKEVINSALASIKIL
ncbi:MAG: hypothetical protein ABFS12_12505 [Bacteroidota bacterium]